MKREAGKCGADSLDVPPQHRATAAASRVRGRPPRRLVADRGRRRGGGWADTRSRCWCSQLRAVGNAVKICSVGTPRRHPSAACRRGGNGPHVRPGCGGHTALGRRRARTGGSSLATAGAPSPPPRPPPRGGAEDSPRTSDDRRRPDGVGRRPCAARCRARPTPGTLPRGGGGGATGVLAPAGGQARAAHQLEKDLPLLWGSGKHQRSPLPGHPLCPS